MSHVLRQYTTTDGKRVYTDVAQFVSSTSSNDSTDTEDAGASVENQGDSTGRASIERMQQPKAAGQCDMAEPGRNA